MNQLLVEQCMYCQKLRYYYVPEKFRSGWIETLPDGVSAPTHQPSTCDSVACIGQNIIFLDKHKLGRNPNVIQEVLLIPRLSIRPFPNQPRKYFDKNELLKLAAMIKESGQLVPVFVKEIKDEPDGTVPYELVEGQRRWHACDMAGVQNMKAIVLSIANEQEQFTNSIMMNFGRVGHDPIEIALAIKRLKDEWGNSIQKIADMFGQSEPWVYQYYGLLRLDQKVLDMMSAGIPEKKRISFSIGTLLSSLPKKDQVPMAEEILKNGTKFLQVKSMIRAKITASGGVGRSKHRRPNNDFQILKNFSARTDREVEAFLTWPQNVFGKAFESRPEKDHEEMVKGIEKCITDLQLLLACVNKAQKK